MKICVFSDIHGNFSALKIAMKEMLKEQADVYLFLGDICGYYFETLRCFEEIKFLPNFHYTLGNHDKIFLDAVSKKCVDAEYTQKYGPSLELLLEKVNMEQQATLAQWLREMPLHIDGEVFYAAHGSPDNCLCGYVYPDSPLPHVVSQKFVFLGHTHCPMIREHNGIMYVNPGSIGQPRHGGQPSYAIADTHSRVCEIKCFRYDIQKFIKNINSVCKPYPYLLQVLQRCTQGI